MTLDIIILKSKSIKEPTKSVQSDLKNALALNCIYCHRYIKWLIHGPILSEPLA